MALDFKECGAVFKNATSQTPNPLANWTYTGPIVGVLGTGDHPTVITYEGCLALCGDGFEGYSWDQAANTITNWVLPIMGGILLQAPFESNRSWENFLALMRWVGSPISSLSSVLWNIKVSRKCALMVDMAVAYDEAPSDALSDFSQMRDVFYILAVMNQFEVHASIHDHPAEKLIRVALFSTSLRLDNGRDGEQDLAEICQILARDLRHGRRRGVVPVFVTIGWFLCALGISIEMAFGNLGGNATAHNLALGLLLAFTAVFVLGSIADRNPVSTGEVRRHLNDFLHRVRLALVTGDYDYVTDAGLKPHDPQFTHALYHNEYLSNSFFSHFAGQGRSRWHYGVAHPVLAGIEDAYVAHRGRNWLRNPQEARAAMVLGSKHAKGIRRFDLRGSWQILSAMTIVLGSILGAFTISYWTPTPGLGCRSGGYTIFIAIAVGSLLLEMFTWWLSSVRFAAFSSLLHSRVEAWLLKPLDLLGTSWLIYMVAAQTFGWYRTCACMSSLWAGQGGYIDFESIDVYKDRGIGFYWAMETGVSLVVLGVAAMFIIAEWCGQSHLGTVDPKAARRGLRRTRTWKYYTSWIRAAPNAVIELVLEIYGAALAMLTKRSRPRDGRRSLVWSAHPKPRVPIMTRGAPIPQQTEIEEARLIDWERCGTYGISTYTMDHPSASHSQMSACTSDPASLNYLQPPPATSRSRSMSRRWPSVNSVFPSPDLLQLSPSPSHVRISPPSRPGLTSRSISAASSSSPTHPNLLHLFPSTPNPFRSRSYL